jgi:hypothetical protein
MKLRVILDLSKFPAGKTVPDEVAHVVREVADWIEKMQGDYEDPGSGKLLRTFESEVAGRAWIEK